MLHLLSPILQLDYPAWRLSRGEDCIYCGQNSWECEHAAEINQDSGEYETEAERNQ